ncbi:MAG: NADH-quinone oxidoreductase subunit C [Bacteroidota bacterium]|nr:NADH-quinone oxidoreductase subunit C [Bacteroidota bacterium]
MTNQEVLDHIRTKFADSILEFDEPYGMLTLIINRDALLPLVEFIKSDELLQCTFMTDLCGMHHPEQKGRELGMVYMFHGWVKNIRIRIKCFMAMEDPHIDSLCNIFKAANWMERETYDFYGIKFKGHPDLRRILNMDEMDYHPMLKQYKLEDGTRTDKDDRFFGRDGNSNVEFDQRYIK